jgi:hypothetical protein
MKKLFSLIIIIIVFSCCNQKRTGENNELTVYPRSEIKILIDSFIQFSNDTSLIYEIYVDKIAHWDYDIVLFAGKRSLIDNGKPIMKTIISGIPIYIYSGVEHYFGVDPSKTNNSQIFDSLPDEIPKGNYWVISEKDGNMSIVKDGFSFPFYRTHRIEFEMPEGNDNDEEPEWIIESLGRKE